MKTCATCSMPLIEKGDFAGGDETSMFCLHCVGADGKVKSGEEIFKGGVDFFVGAIGGDRKMAEKVTRKNMNGLKYWKEHPCEILKGDTATDAEFAEVMKKL